MMPEKAAEISMSEKKANFLQDVLKHFGVCESAIKQKRSTQNTVFARWCYWLFLYSQGHTLQDCANDTGGNDHTSVRYALQKISYEYTTNPQFSSRAGALFIKYNLKSYEYYRDHKNKKNRCDGTGRFIPGRLQRGERIKEAAVSVQ